MSFEIQTHWIYANDNSPAFQFTGTIGAYVYAIQQVNFQSAIAGTAITNLKVSLSEFSGGVGQTSVVLSQEMEMDSLNLSESYTIVSVLAWLGEGAPPGAIMQNLHGIGVGSTCTAAAAEQYGAAPLIAAAGIAGFDLSFPSSSGVVGIGVSCGAVQYLFGTQPSVAVVAQGTLTGGQPFTGTVDAALLVMAQQQPNLAVDIVSCGTTLLSSQQTVGPYLGGTDLTAAAFFIQSFFAQFDISNWNGNTLYTLLMGVEWNSILLNQGAPGTITYTAQQNLSGFYLDREGYSHAGSAVNLITNYLLVALGPQPDP